MTKAGPPSTPPTELSWLDAIPSAPGGVRRYHGSSTMAAVERPPGPVTLRPRRTVTIDDIRERARIRGGECLSESYVDDQAPLRWRCSNHAYPVNTHTHYM